MRMTYYFVRGIAVMFVVIAAFFLFLCLFGLILARHVDNTVEVLGRVWLFAKAFGGLLVIGCCWHIWAETLK